MKARHAIYAMLCVLLISSVVLTSATLAQHAVSDRGVI